MRVLNEKELTEIDLFNISDIEKVKDIKDLFKDLNDYPDGILCKYIHNEFLENEKVKFVFTFDEKDKKYIHVYDKIKAQVLVIYQDFNNRVLIDNRLKQYSVSELLKYITEYISDIYSLMIEYRLYGEGRLVMSRNNMIEFIKKYNYIPITHEYFDNDEYIFNDQGIIKDENGYYFEDWGLHNRADIHNGIRMRTEGNWETGWKIKVFDNWYDEILKISKKG